MSCPFPFSLAVTLIVFCAIPTFVHAQTSAAVSANTTVVKAGEPIVFDVTVNRPTTLDGCSIAWTVAQSAIPFYTYQASEPLPRGQTKVTISYPVPFDATGGQYALATLVFISASKQIPLSFTQVGFEVIPNTGIQYPSSADVAIKPSQVQLFRTEARALTQRLQELRANAGASQDRNRGLTLSVLSTVIAGDLQAIRHTAERFNALGVSPALSRLAVVFFSDLELNYVQARESIHRLGEFHPQSTFRNALFDPQDSRVSADTLPTQLLYRAEEQNVLGYTQVAETSAMSFDLKVVSSPTGATITYGRRGDKEQEWPDPTTATISSLPLATWIIHFHMKNYREVEREFNPFIDSEHVVTATLQLLTK